MQINLVCFYSGVHENSISSWIQFNTEGSNRRIKDYILYLLGFTAKPLSTRQISELSGIEIGSLTAPLKELRQSNSIQVLHHIKNAKTGRVAMAYSLTIKPSK